MAINIDKSAKDGDPGAEGFTVPGQALKGADGARADCNWLDDDCATTGHDGGPGVNGGPGGQGLPGANAPTFLIIEVDKFDFDVQVAVRGGAGGKGGRGGSGQQGGKGGRGGDGGDCEFGRHGGNGGKGGDAGQGGPGGRGGRGGNVSVLVKEAANPKSMLFDVSGGPGGLPGDPGVPGIPSPPGDDGLTTGMFASSDDCPNMGPVGQWGAQGAVPTPNSNGADGADGNRPEIKIVP